MLTDRQLDLMNLLWERGSATVREAKDALDDDLAYTSVLTVFQTLEKNGHVRHEPDGKAYRYYARTTRADAAYTFAGFLRANDLLEPVATIATEGGLPEPKD